MSFFKKLQERIIPVNTTDTGTVLRTPPPDIRREFIHFPTAYRIGILAYYTNNDDQEIINNYKKQIEKLGYECEVLMFVDKKEKDHNVYLQYFNWDDLDKKYMLPYSPRTDRFIVKRYDLLLNLYHKPYPPLMFISNMSYAKCRVGPYIESIKECLDILIPHEPGDNLPQLIEKINTTLKLQQYERKAI